MELSQKIEELIKAGIETVRVTYSDIHGTYRGKEVMLQAFAEAAGDGFNFAAANLVDGLDGVPTEGPGMPAERGFPDMLVKPVLPTLRILPWKRNTAWCLGHVQPVEGADQLSPRCLLESVLKEFAEIGLTPIIAPELEFYLFREGEGGKLERYVDRHAMVYTVGQRADPEGVIQEMLKYAYRLGLNATVANHEFGRGQFEINLKHGEAMETADRAFLFKAMVKEIAAHQGLLATFIGKPLNDDEGSGLHLHVSLENKDGKNIFHDPEADDGLSTMARHFLAGVLAHAPAATAFLAPTINAYRRFATGELAPAFANWGYENRLTFVRVPHERGKATRFEIRLADGSANPYLLAAVTLAAGLDGLRRKPELSPPVEGAIIGPGTGSPIPSTLEGSLAALREDTTLQKIIGAALVDAFLLLKEAEIKRFNAYVTNWEINEYIWHL